MLNRSEEENIQPTAQTYIVESNVDTFFLNL
jgi:hypothetical protein